MEKIRTTFMPHQELEVDDAEAASLRQLGVVLDDTKATTDAGLVKAAEKQVAASVPEDTAAPAPQKPAARKRAAAKQPPTPDGDPAAQAESDAAGETPSNDDQPEG